jgi:HK97 family phage prohead protease
MPRFVLNDERVLNSYGFKIKTAGIYLGRFISNPVMLDGHNNSNASVIGRWKEWKAEDVILSADTDFDMEDPKAADISGKVDRDFIKSASMGIAFKKADLKMIGGELVLEKCELLEASIVAIPSNSAALKLTMDGESLSDTDVKELCLTVAQNSDSDNPKITHTMLKLSQIAFIALGFSATMTEASEDQINTAVLALSKEKDELKKKLELSEDKVNAYETAEKTKKQGEITQMVDAALTAGKITADKKQTYIDFGGNAYRSPEGA